MSVISGESRPNTPSHIPIPQNCLQRHLSHGPGEKRKESQTHQHNQPNNLDNIGGASPNHNPATTPVFPHHHITNSNTTLSRTRPILPYPFIPVHRNRNRGVGVARCDQHHPSFSPITHSPSSVTTMLGELGWLPVGGHRLWSFPVCKK